MQYDPFAANRPYVGEFYGFGPGQGDEHAAAVDQFAAWLRANNAAVYSKIAARRPDLLSGKAAVANGSLGAIPPWFRQGGGMGMLMPGMMRQGRSRGMGDVTAANPDVPTIDLSTPDLASQLGPSYADSSASVPTVTLSPADSASSASSAPATPQTNWGSDLLNMFKTVAPTVYQFKTQSDLIRLNIARAEKGLPPIDASAVSPTVNVGVARNVTTLAYIGIGAVVLVALMKR